MSIVSECTLRLEILHHVANNLGLLERAFSKIFLVAYLLSKSVNPYSRAGNGDCGLLLLQDALNTLAGIGHCPRYSHAFQETNSLRRTIQIAECSLLHRRAQGRVPS